MELEVTVKIRGKGDAQRFIDAINKANEEANEAGENVLVVIVREPSHSGFRVAQQPKLGDIL